MKQLIKIVFIILIGWGLISNIALVFSFDKIYPETCDLTAVAKVVSLKTEKARSNSYVVKIVKSNMQKTKNTKLILYTSQDCDLKYGDMVQLEGEFSKGAVARNYKGFSYRNYLKQSKIYGSLYAKNPQILKHQPSLMEKIYDLKIKFYEVLEKIYTEDTNAFLQGILLGDSSHLDDEIKENFKNSSMSHVLAISGMHVSYVVIGMQLILDQFINRKKLKNMLILAMLAFFVLITGGAPSCMRACIMSGMLLISQNFYRKNNFYVTILFTFFVLLFINPFNIFAVGMWLSFGGTLGIVLFHNFLKRFFVCKWKIKSKFVKAFLEVFLVSFAAQILIVPIMVYCFNTISFTFFVSNLMIYFLVGPILAIGYISMLIGLFFPSIGAIFAIVEEFFVAIIFKVAEICSQLPFSKIYLATPDFWMVILYYVAISAVIFLFHQKKFQFLRIILSNRTSQALKKHWKKLIALAIVVVMLLKIVSLIPCDLKIYFVDVGQRRLLCHQKSDGKEYHY